MFLKLADAAREFPSKRLSRSLERAMTVKLFSTAPAATSPFSYDANRLSRRIHGRCVRVLLKSATDHRGRFVPRDYRILPERLAPNGMMWRRRHQSTCLKKL